jgi:radical SAM/Cys-rich protein
LNARGYGRPNSGLILDLVHNPVGAHLPGCQVALEDEYLTRLSREHDIEFIQLFSFNNCPAGRHLDSLKSSGNPAQYMSLLKQAFNPLSLGKVMCCTTLSVGYYGRLFDCDFNQVLDLSVIAEVPIHVGEFDYDKLARRQILVRSHCFACTAGNGSSCQGTNGMS